MTLAALLLDHPFADDEPLLHTFDRSMTAGEARASARAVAGELTDAVGDLTGRAVAVQLPNGPELVTTMVGVWLAGGVYVPVNPRFPEPRSTWSSTRPGLPRWSPRPASRCWWPGPSPSPTSPMSPASPS